MNRFLEWPLNPLAGYASHGKAQVFVAKPPVRKMKKNQSTNAGFAVRVL